MKIALILPYFGKFRNDIDFWVKSVSYNPSIDFFLFTDLNICNRPSNLKVIKMTFEEIKERAQSLFDFPICLPYVYKLCDYKVVYGQIFADYLQGYDFWGHCDNDLIFGNIKKFITDDILQKYDRILSRGHFTLYRNSSNVNEIYKKASPSYLKVFSSEKIYGFDEWPGTSAYWKEQKLDSFYDSIVYDDIDYNKYHFVTVHKKELDKGKSNFIYSFNEGRLFRVYLSEGGLCSDEIMYVHFQKRKLEIRTIPAEKFLIIPNKIVAYRDIIDVKYLKDVAYKRYIYMQAIIRKAKKLRKMILHF